MSEIKRWLDAHGHSQKWLADRLAVTQQQVSSWVAGKHRPDDLYAFAIEQLTGGEVSAMRLRLPGVDDPLLGCLEYARRSRCEQMADAVAT